MTSIEKANRIQLHYFFNDDSHTIDAVVRNECEKEILSLIREISTSLGIKVSIESFPTEEGGFVEAWKLLGKNSPQLTLIITIAVAIISRYPVENEELTQLQIENLKLDNEIKKKELEKLELEFLQEDQDLTREKVSEAVELIKKDYKITWRKSNLYKKLRSYPKVDSIEFQRQFMNLNVGEPLRVRKENFSRFVLRSDNLPDNEGIEGVIDVISPVFKPGKFRWKGFYNKEIITFEMLDQEFKNKVLRGEIHFSNTFSIQVEMVQARKIDQDGSIKVTNTKVTKVLATIENGIKLDIKN